ncbi:hypothetical protein CLOM_g6779, partial [Closterium sp. NIES-68]
LNGGLNGTITGAVNGAVGALNGSLDNAMGSLNGSLNGALGSLNGSLNNALNSAVNRVFNSSVASGISNLLPQQAGMLRGVLTSCNGLLSLQAGAADIQILKIGSNYLVTYYLYAAGVTKAPDSQAIYKGSACSADATAALNLPGTWQPMSPVSWSLANVALVSAADVADVLASIQGVTNDDLYLGLLEPMGCFQESSLVAICELVDRENVQ